MKKINKAFKTWNHEDFFKAAIQGVGMKGEKDTKVWAFEALKYLCMASTFLFDPKQKTWLISIKEYLQKIYEQS